MVLDPRAGKPAAWEAVAAASGAAAAAGCAPPPGQAPILRALARTSFRLPEWTDDGHRNALFSYLPGCGPATCPGQDERRAAQRFFEFQAGMGLSTRLPFCAAEAATNCALFRGPVPQALVDPWLWCAALVPLFVCALLAARAGFGCSFSLVGRRAARQCRLALSFGGDKGWPLAGRILRWMRSRATGSLRATRKHPARTVIVLVAALASAVAVARSLVRAFASSPGSAALSIPALVPGTLSPNASGADMLRCMARSVSDISLTPAGVVGLCQLSALRAGHALAPVWADYAGRWSPGPAAPACGLGHDSGGLILRPDLCLLRGGSGSLRERVRWSAAAGRHRQLLGSAAVVVSRPPPAAAGAPLTCAVVGGARALLARRDGAAIDSHDVIIRMNNAPWLGYEAHAGSRTTVRLLNSPRDIAAVEAAGGLDPEELIVYPAQTIVESGRTFGFERSTALLHDAVASAAGRGLTSYGEPRFHVLSPLVMSLAWRAVSAGEVRPSTGLVSVVTALALCDEVTVYGFHSSEMDVIWSRNCTSESGGGKACFRLLPGRLSSAHYFGERERRHAVKVRSLPHRFDVEREWMVALDAAGHLRLVQYGGEGEQRLVQA